MNSMIFNNAMERVEHRGRAMELAVRLHEGSPVNNDELMLTAEYIFQWIIGDLSCVEEKLEPAEEKKW